MIKKITLLLLLITSVNFYSQKKLKGNGVVTVKKKKLKDFKKIILNNDFKVTLIKSDSPAIEIETDENLHDYINYSVSDSLFILKSDNKLRPKKTLNITLFCSENLSEIQLYSDSEIESLNTLNLASLIVKINNFSKADLSVKSDYFQLINKNKSKIQLRAKTKLNIDSNITDLSTGASSDTQVIIRADSLNINSTEKATLEIEGSVNSSNITTSNSSTLDGKNLNAKTAHLVTKDGSELSIKVFDDVIIESSGKSKLDLYGNPKIELKRFTNTAELHKKELSKK